MSKTSVKPVLFTGKRYSDGTSPIMIRITANRVVKYIATGHSAVVHNWNPLDNRVYESKPRLSAKLKEQLSPEAYKNLEGSYRQAQVLPNAAKINATIEDKLHEIQAQQRKMEVNDEHVSSLSLKTRIVQKNKAEVAGDVFTYATKVIERLKESGKAGTMKGYKTIMSRLKEYHKGPLRFDDITYSFLNDYETYLGKKGYKMNYVHNNLKTLKALYRQAVHEGVTSSDKNPFSSFKMKIDNNVQKERLTWEELKRIKELDLEAHSKLWDARNFFLFSFYMAGIRVSDLIQLRWENIVDDRIEYNMDKTGRFKSIQIRKELADILKLYRKRTSKSDDFIFPLFDKSMDYSDPFFLKSQISSKTAGYNRDLKRLADMAGINKTITTHIARHTFADFARRKGAAVYDVSKALGHSSIKITESYLAKFDYDTQDDTLNKIFGDQ